MELSIVVAVSLIFIGAVHTEEQCFTERTSNMKFSVRRVTNGTGYRLVQANLVNDGTKDEAVDMSVEHWTALAGVRETVAMAVVVTAGTFTMASAVVPTAATSMPQPVTIPAVLTCLNGYEKVPGVGCYKEIKTYMTWEQAKNGCEKDGTYLAIPNSKQEMDFFKKVYGRPGNALWVGVKNTGGTWTTVAGHVLDSSNFTVWEQNYPTGEGNCAVARGSGLQNEPCSESNNRSICEQRLP